MKKIKLIKGKKYSICSCGLTQVLPFCDNSHRSINKAKKTNYKSLKIVAEESLNIELNCSNWIK